MKYLRDRFALKNKSLPTLRRETFNLNLITINQQELLVRLYQNKYYAKPMMLLFTVPLIHLTPFYTVNKSVSRELRANTHVRKIIQECILCIIPW
ncbi:hypothetical protein A0256_06665 [Mucilaginibacter sp. PAMC 26640]|nr:hypothetical protein A0256_06665 [Mucilaginibacter sp. PAMC 26640]